MAEEKLLERLYGLPLEGFVAARDEAVRHLRQDGKAEAAEQVAELRKPTVSAWAVNQLARSHAARLGERLARDLDPSGFGDLGPIAAEEAGHNGEPATRQARERRQAFRGARDEARKQAAASADRAIMARREAERLRAAAAQAEEAAARARSAADAATRAEREASERAASSAEALAEAEARLAKV